MIAPYVVCTSCRRIAIAVVQARILWCMAEVTVAAERLVPSATRADKAGRTGAIRSTVGIDSTIASRGHAIICSCVVR